MLANPKKDYETDARKELPEMILIFAETKDPKIREYLALALDASRSKGRAHAAKVAQR